MTIEIRDATVDDAAVIADYNNRLCEETEGRSLNPNRIGPGVVAMLGDRTLGRYWVAEADGRVVGQIAITYEWSDWRNGMMWYLQSVYVHPDYRRQGVYSALHGHVESLARSDPQVVGIRLYVEMDNDRAQRTYTNKGMTKTGYEMMQIIVQEPSDLAGDP